jgi:hypothetical protein
MALSAIYTAKYYEIIGLPLSGSDNVITTTLAHMPITQIGRYEPTFTHSDISSLRTSINARLAVITAETQTLVEARIDRYYEIGPTNPMSIREADNGVKGNIIDYDQERKIIRTQLGNLIGVYVPEDGWCGELQRMFNLNSYPYANNGDR